MHLRYKRGGSGRTINAHDLSRRGVDGHKLTHWNAENNYTAEVSDEAGNWLLEHEKADWEQVDEPSNTADATEALAAGQADDSTTSTSLAGASGRAGAQGSSGRGHSSTASP